MNSICRSPIARSQFWRVSGPQTVIRPMVTIKPPIEPTPKFVTNPVTEPVTKSNTNDKSNTCKESTTGYDVINEAIGWTGVVSIIYIFFHH